MKKIPLLLLLWGIGLVASEKVTIVADKFEANEKVGVSKFIGHVKMTKGADQLNASTVYVYFSDNKKPMRYEAKGNVRFQLQLRGGQHYVGQAGRLIYRPNRQIYELYDKVVLREPKLNRVLTGQKVVVEKSSGRARVEGSQTKPVKFIFRVNEKQE